ncbi:hypothetical protein DAEQUDRAFT_674633, partial [Daedalea quercina L-15889]
DPAIERWNHMRETVYQRFRFTPRATMQVLVGLVFFPGVIYWLARDQDLKWKWSGKLKNQSLSRVPLTAEESG